MHHQNNDKPDGRPLPEIALDERSLRALFGQAGLSPQLPLALISILLEDADTEFEELRRGLASREAELRDSRGTTDHHDYLACRRALKRLKRREGAGTHRIVRPIWLKLFGAAVAFEAEHGRAPTIGELRREVGQETPSGTQHSILEMDPANLRRTAKAAGVRTSSAKKLGKLRMAHRVFARRLERDPTVREFHIALDAEELPYPNIHEGGWRDLLDLAKTGVLKEARLTAAAWAIWDGLVHIGRRGPSNGRVGGELASSLRRLRNAYPTDETSNRSASEEWPEFRELLDALFAAELRHFGRCLGLSFHSE